MDEIPARSEEIHHAIEEGIDFQLLRNPVKVIGDENGYVTGLECVKMELGEPDASGRRRPIVKEGSEFVLNVDTMIMALGTSPEPADPLHHPGSGNQQARLHRYRRRRRQNQPRWCVRRRRCRDRRSTVIKAMGAGKAAAKAIDEYIQSK